MFITRTLSALLFTSITLTLTLPVAASDIYELQSYHASEAQGERKGPWLGLQQTNKSWRLVPVKPRFKKVADPISNEGIEVSAKVDNVRIMLSDRSLKAGTVMLSDEARVVSGSLDEEFELSSLPPLGQERLMHFMGSEYRLQNRDGKIYLSLQGGEQYLFDYTENQEDNNARLIWVGDLDHDGKLDFIIDTSNHYNVTELRLYLSGQAGKGELLKLVAKRRSTGC